MFRPCLPGLPSLRLEWDLKLWWVHCEAMVALLTAYKDTNHPELWDMFKLVADYAFKHVSYKRDSSGRQNSKILNRS